MKFSNISLLHGFLLVLLSMIFVLTGCNNPADSEEDPHEEANGAVFKMNGEEIIRYENGETTGSIEVTEGEETPRITIYFLDEDGDEFQPDEPEFTLSWRDIDSSIAEIEQHDEDGKWSFHVRGVMEGSTGVIFELDHNGHPDFEIHDITIHVN